MFGDDDLGPNMLDIITRG